ncbi:helix-turn-helix domain-containing protein [Leptolyngbyaceae cyanobacterium UHCC 1019]
MEKFSLKLVSSVDEGFLAKLAVAVQESRGKLSQREFAEVLGVSQSTVQQWENGKNVPSLENLEKIARIKGMLVEAFVAYLYGRTGGLTSKDILDRVEVMPSQDFAQVLRVMADRMATAKDAPPLMERKGKGEGDRVPLDLPERVEMDEVTQGTDEEMKDEA